MTPEAGRGGGHSAGTARREKPADARCLGRAQDTASSAFPARLLGVDDAAAYLSVSAWTVRDLIANGTLARVRLALGRDRDCRRLLVDRLELDALIERSKERGAL